MAEAGGAHGVQGQLGLYGLHLKKKRGRFCLLEICQTYSQSPCKSEDLGRILNTSHRLWCVFMLMTHCRFQLPNEDDLQGFPQPLLTSRPGDVASGFLGLWYYAGMVSLILTMQCEPQSQHAQRASFSPCNASLSPSMHSEPLSQVSCSLVSSQDPFMETQDIWICTKYNEDKGMGQWIRCLWPSLTTWIQSLEFKRWKERTASQKLVLTSTGIRWHTCILTSKQSKIIK